MDLKISAGTVSEGSLDWLKQTLTTVSMEVALALMKLLLCGKICRIFLLMKLSTVLQI